MRTFKQSNPANSPLGESNRNSSLRIGEEFQERLNDQCWGESIAKSVCGKMHSRSRKHKIFVSLSVFALMTMIGSYAYYERQVESYETAILNSVTDYPESGLITLLESE